MNEQTNGGNGNGHALTLFGADGLPMSSSDAVELRDLAAQLRTLQTNVLFARSQWAKQIGLAFDGKRDYYTVFGYPASITATEYRETYQRGGIAKRIVEAYPRATWRGGVEVYEDDDPETETPFEQAFKELDARLHIWAMLERADILAGLSTYSTILLGSAIDSNLETPLPKSRNGGQGLIYLTPYWSGGGPTTSNNRLMQLSSLATDVDATIESYETDPTNPRFGEPAFYTLRRMNMNLPAEGRRVHWSRIIHIAEGTLDDNVFGIPTLENVWNLLHDLMKVTGGGSEAFFLRANQGLHLDIDKDMKLDDAKLTLEKLKEDLEKYQHNLSRWIRTKGVNVDVLGSDVANFSSPADAILKQIAGSKGIPLRILTGSEMGQLASSQDAENWNAQVQDRRTSHAEPHAVRQLVDRLIEYGYLPTPAQPYKVGWPVEEEMSETGKADFAQKLAQANATFGDVLFTEPEIRDMTFSMKPITDEQRKEINDRKQEEAAAALKQQQEAMKAQQPAEPPPGAEPGLMQPRAARALEPLVAHLTVAIAKKDYAEVGAIVRHAAEWNEEDHPRDEKGQFANAPAGADFGRHTPGTFRQYPGGVKPRPRSERVIEGPIGVFPPHEARQPSAATNEAPDTAPNGSHMDTIEHPVSVEGSSRNNGGGVNKSLKIETEDGTFLFKPIDGEAFGMRSGRIDNDSMPLAEREVIAARFDHELQLDDTPNTVMIDFHGQKGSAMTWVDDADAVGDVSRLDQKEVARLGILDAVIGNLDRHRGNALVEDGHLRAIDHGYTFGKTVPGGDLRSFATANIKRGALSIKEQKEIADKLDNLNYSKLLHGSHIDTDEREALYERVNAVSHRLALGEAHLINTDFDVDGW